MPPSTNMAVRILTIASLLFNNHVFAIKPISPFLSPTPDTTAELAGNYTAYNFTQLTSHFLDPLPDGFNRTFQQRYWIDTQYYKLGGPVILLDSGEVNGELRVQFLKQGIAQRLAQATNGVGIIFEHRFYGESYVTADLSLKSLALLTTQEALADAPYFSLNFPYAKHGLPASIISSSTPWIHYGGSYAGALSAFRALLYPEQFYGAIASSGVVNAIENFWEYLEPIRLNGDPTCIGVIIDTVEDIDAAIARAGKDADGNEIKSPEVVAIMKEFGVNELKSVKRFAETISSPIPTWQSKTWDTSGADLGLEEGEALAFDRFCGNLTLNLSNGTAIEKREQGFKNYAAYINNSVSTEGFDDNLRGNYEAYVYEQSNSTDYWCCETLEDDWRLWSWQVCTEYGFFMPGAPEGVPSLYSRSMTLEWAREYCVNAFGFPKDFKLNTTVINQYGGFNLSSPNLYYVDGNQDPWLYATVHSPLAYPRENLSRPDLPYDGGSIIDPGWHRSDENGLPNPADEPERIQKVHAAEIAVVQGWVKEFYEKKGAGVKERAKVGVWKQGL